MSAVPREDRAGGVAPTGRNAIVTLLVAVLSLTVIATLGIGYAITVGTMRDQARKLMEVVSDQGVGRIVEFLQPTATIADLQFQLAATGLAAPGAEADLERFFLEQLRRKPNLAGVHFGSHRGDFVYATREVPGAAAPYLSKTIIAGDARTTELALRRDDLSVITRRLDPDDEFDPRRRPWYAAIGRTDQETWTEPYQFYTSGRPGITVAAPVLASDGRIAGVVALDLEIGQLARFLADIRIASGGGALIIDDAGRLIAAAGAPDDPATAAAVRALGATMAAPVAEGSPFIDFDVGGRAYFGSALRFPAKPVPWIIGVYAPQAAFHQYADRAEFLLLIAAGVIAVLAAGGGIWFGIGVDRALRRINAAQLMRESERRFEKLAEALPLPVTLTGIEDRRVVFANQRAREIFGFTGDLDQVNASDFYADTADTQRLRTRLREDGIVDQQETVMRRVDGSTFWALLSARIFDYRGQAMLLTGINDISERKAAEQVLAHAAYRDSLTGLPNRVALRGRLAEAEAAHIAGGALIVLAVDQLRQIDDQMGQKSGDALLTAVAERLTQVVALESSPGNMVARLIGGEFAIWLASVTDEEAAISVAERIANLFAVPVMIAESSVSVSLSIGVAFNWITGGKPDALTRDARLAVDDARGGRGNRVAQFDDRRRRQHQRRQLLTDALPAAIANDDVVLHYQPLVRLADGAICGFEALARWSHTELGAVPPEVFIPLAEETGLILPLGRKLIEAAVDQLAAWTDGTTAAAPLSIAVNLSPRQFMDPLWVRSLNDYLDTLGPLAHRLKMEVTESVFMDDPEMFAEILESIRRRGVRLSLDDFGTGYSSLSYLNRFRFDVLKIDRSFVSRMLMSPEADRLVRSIIDLAHDLDMEVVAEGIEHEAEAERLRRYGCEVGQGFLYSRPVIGSLAERMLRGWPTPVG